MRWHERLRAKAVAKRELWMMGLPSDTLPILGADVDRLCVRMTWTPPGGEFFEDHYVLKDEMADWLFENTSGHRLIVDLLEPDHKHDAKVTMVAIRFKSVRDLIAFKLAFAIGDEIEIGGAS